MPIFGLTTYSPTTGRLQNDPLTEPGRAGSPVRRAGVAAEEKEAVMEDSLKFMIGGIGGGIAVFILIMRYHEELDAVALWCYNFCRKGKKASR